MMTKRCSIIIRTKNEERWIGPCLSSVYNQNYNNFEVIIVDNESTDKTLEKAGKFSVDRIVTCRDYLPGKALNIGINASTGDYIVCLSGHCIPVDENWLGNLVAAIEKNNEIAGVYGRQEPMAFSKDADKRDLLLVFGLDAKLQSKDSFFHNANSILKRELWVRTPFDDQVTNIEDRLWAQQMLNQGHKIAYEPAASVYHHHGIHQDGNLERCNNIVRILESLNSEENGGVLDAEDLNIVAIIPSRGKSLEISGKPAIEYTINSAKASKYIDRIFVSTDNHEMAAIANKLDADTPFIRPAHLSYDYVGLEAVFRYSLQKIEQSGVYPDLVVIMEPTFPFRTDTIVDDMIKHILSKGLSTVVAARRESNSLWKEKETGIFERLDSGYVPRKYKERSFIGLKGLCCVTHPEMLRQERILGSRVGLFEVDNPFSWIEVRTEKDIEIAEKIMQIWKQQV